MKRAASPYFPPLISYNPFAGRGDIRNPWNDPTVPFGVQYEIEVRLLMRWFNAIAVIRRQQP